MSENAINKPHTKGVETLEVPGYKKTKFGIAPMEWPEKRLEEVCVNFKSGNGITSKDIRDAGEYLVYGGNGVRGYTSKFTHDGNYFLIGRQGALCGNIVMVSGKNFISEHAIAVKTNSDNDLEYLAYRLDAAKLNRLSESSAQPGLSVSKLLRLKFALPPLPEQQKIAAILSTWDEAIENTQNLITQLKNRKKGLMLQLLTGKTRLPGFDGEWEEVNLGDVSTRVTKKNTELNDTVITISAKRGFVKQEDYFNKRVASATLSGYYLIEKGQFAYNKSYSKGYPMGAVKRLDTLDKAVVTTLYICFELKENVDSDFFLSYFEGGLMINNLMRIAQEGGRAHGLLNISLGDFFGLKLTLPPMEEQQAISNVLNVVGLEITQQENYLAALQTQKKGLMQQLLTGKVRVTSPTSSVKLD